MKCPLTSLVILLTMSIPALGQSIILYTLELGGDNQSARWENGELPSFLQGTTDQDRIALQGEDLTWAVRVSVGGTQAAVPGRIAPGDGFRPLGAAHLVFDLVLCEADGQTPVDLGAASLQCADGKQPGDPTDPDVHDCYPIDAGFWSSINDGDADGNRGLANGPDLLANAALARAIRLGVDGAVHYPEGDSVDLYTLADPAPSGPNFDFGWYPTANGRGGIRLHATSAADTSVYHPSLRGRLAGFCAGYLGYDYASYRPGVGMECFDYWLSGWGFGAWVNLCDSPGLDDPTAMQPSTDVERVLFEGQISTIGIQPGAYVLKVIPRSGNNVLHGNVAWDSDQADYGGWMTFAARADSATAWPLLPETNEHGLRFQIATSVVNRHIFYNNSFYDGGDAGIDLRDYDAIDTSKSPLFEGDASAQASFSNWTSYTKGINGLIYHFAGHIPSISQADFQFLEIGRLGTDPGRVVTPSGFEVFPGSGSQALTRVAVSFADGELINTWLKVTIGTGSGLPAPEVHYWGNAIGDTGIGNLQPYILVDETDEIAARDNPRSPWNRAPVDDAYDFNKDSLVNSTDELLARDNPRDATNCVQMIVR